ncbi:MAG: ABC transporter permease subunit, partial [Planctomycetota bacterium]
MLTALRTNAWAGMALALAGLILAPVLVVISRITHDSEGVWQHLAETVLADYVLNTVLLAGGVGLGATVIGVGTAWLVTMHRFPGRRIMTWALLLPLAMPTYLMAYTYTDLFQFSGSFRTAVRASWGSDAWVPEIRSMGGAIVTFSLVLYPYVFLVVRAAFLSQSLCVLEVSRTLGRGPWQTFWTIALPLARPAMAAGASLVLMETLAEYGAVDYFAVDTFTTGIYRAWTSLGSPEAAAQLAAALVLVVLVALSLERFARGQARYDPTTNGMRARCESRLPGLRSAAALAACALPVCLGFLLPGGVLVRLALNAENSLGVAGLLSLTGNT